MSRAFIPGSEFAAYERFKLGTFGAGKSRQAAAGASAPGGAPAEDSAADAARKAAQADGYAAGYAAGAAAVKQEAARLRSIAEDAAATSAEAEHELAGDVLDLALEIARQVLRGDLRARRDALLNVVREALAALPQTAQAPSLALNPGDVALVRAQIGDELTALGCRVSEDFRIEPGGCRVGSTACEVDATLATRWRRVISALGRDTAWTEPDE